MVAVADRLNAAVAYSRIGRWFQLEVCAAYCEGVSGADRELLGLWREE
jgi:hypothetical protein